MDQMKIGRYIALLRRQAGLTQEKLGEKLGVTNKTISRWENGNYMPDIEMFGLLAKEFHVSINDLLAGEKIPDEDFRQKADENIITVAASSAFSFDERKTYFKKKWRKEHISLFVIIGLILITALIIPFVIHKPWLIGLLPILAVVGHCYQHNKMMIYVENNLYHDEINFYFVEKIQRDNGALLYRYSPYVCSVRPNSPDT